MSINIWGRNTTVPQAGGTSVWGQAYSQGQQQAASGMFQGNITRAILFIQTAQINVQNATVTMNVPNMPGPNPNQPNPQQPGGGFGGFGLAQSYVQAVISRNPSALLNLIPRMGMAGMGMMGGGLLGVGAAAGLAGIGALTAAVMAPYFMGSLWEGAISRGRPYTDLTKSMWTVGRAGGMGGNQLGDFIRQFYPSYGQPVIGDRAPPPPEWMSQLGLGPQDIARIMGGFGVAPRFENAQEMVRVSRVMELSRGFQGMEAGTIGRLGTMGMTLGMNPNNPEGFRAFASIFEQAMTKALDSSLNRSVLLRSMEGSLQHLASTGAATLDPTWIANYTMQLATQMGTPGARTGQMAQNIIAGSAQTFGNITQYPMAQGLMLRAAKMQGGLGTVARVRTFAGIPSTFGISPDFVGPPSEMQKNQELMLQRIAANWDKAPAVAMRDLLDMTRGNPDLKEHLVGQLVSMYGKGPYASFLPDILREIAPDLAGNYTDLSGALTGPGSHRGGDINVIPGGITDKEGMTLPGIRARDKMTGGISPVRYSTGQLDAIRKAAGGNEAKARFMETILAIESGGIVKHPAREVTATKSKKKDLVSGYIQMTGENALKYFGKRDITDVPLDQQLEGMSRFIDDLISQNKLDLSRDPMGALSYYYGAPGAAKDFNAGTMNYKDPSMAGFMDYQRKGRTYWTQLGGALTGSGTQANDVTGLGISPELADVMSKEAEAMQTVMKTAEAEWVTFTPLLKDATELMRRFNRVFGITVDRLEKAAGAGAMPSGGEDWMKELLTKGYKQ